MKNPFYNINLMTSDHLRITERVQFRFPHSKKWRIRLKWKRRNVNYRSVEKDQAYMFRGTLICSPSLYKKICDGVITNIEKAMINGYQ